MRTLPALLGSAIPPVIYAIMRESGYPRIVGLFSAFLVLFGACEECCACDGQADADLAEPRQTTPTSPRPASSSSTRSSSSS